MSLTQIGTKWYADWTNGCIHCSLTLGSVACTAMWGSMELHLMLVAHAAYTIGVFMWGYSATAGSMVLF